MEKRTRRILRTLLAVVGLLAGLLGVATLALLIVLRPPGDTSGALWGSGGYLAIAVVRFIAVWRLKPPAGEPPSNLVDR